MTVAAADPPCLLDLTRSCSHNCRTPCATLRSFYTSIKRCVMHYYATRVPESVRGAPHFRAPDMCQTQFVAAHGPAQVDRLACSCRRCLSVTITTRPSLPAQVFAGIGFDGRGALYSAFLHSAASGAGATPSVASPVMSIGGISVHKQLKKCFSLQVDALASTSHAAGCSGILHVT